MERGSAGVTPTAITRSSGACSRVGGGERTSRSRNRRAVGGTLRGYGATESGRRCSATRPTTRVEGTSLGCLFGLRVPATFRGTGKRRFVSFTGRRRR